MVNMPFTLSTYLQRTGSFQMPFFLLMNRKTERLLDFEALQSDYKLNTDTENTIFDDIEYTVELSLYSSSELENCFGEIIYYKNLSLESRRSKHVMNKSVLYKNKRV